MKGNSDRRTNGQHMYAVLLNQRPGVQVFPPHGWPRFGRIRPEFRRDWPQFFDSSIPGRCWAKISPHAVKQRAAFLRDLPLASVELVRTSADATHNFEDFARILGQLRPTSAPAFGPMPESTNFGSIFGRSSAHIGPDSVNCAPCQPNLGPSLVFSGRIRPNLPPPSGATTFTWERR